MKDNIETLKPCREAFEHIQSKAGIELTMDSDLWGRPVYAHEYVEIRWLGFQEGCKTRAEPSVPTHDDDVLKHLGSVLTIYAERGETPQEEIDIIEAAYNALRDHDKSFSVRWEADMRAIKRWQESGGDDLTWPDHADLVVWLIGQLQAQNTEPAKPTSGSIETVREAVVGLSVDDILTIQGMVEFCINRGYCMGVHEGVTYCGKPRAATKRMARIAGIDPRTIRKALSNLMERDKFIEKLRGMETLRPAFGYRNPYEQGRNEGIYLAIKLALGEV